MLKTSGSLKSCLVQTNSYGNLTVVYICGGKEDKRKLPPQIYVFNQELKKIYLLNLTINNSKFKITKIWLFGDLIFIFIKNIFTLKIVKNLLEYKSFLVHENIIGAIFENEKNVIFIAESMAVKYLYYRFIHFQRTVQKS